MAVTRVSAKSGKSGNSVFFQKVREKSENLEKSQGHFLRAVNFRKDIKISMNFKNFGV